MPMPSNPGKPVGAVKPVDPGKPSNPGKPFPTPGLNSPPSSWTDLDEASNIIDENASNGDLVGLTAHAVDPQGTAVTYMLYDNAGGRFKIDPITGVVSVANADLIDYEQATSHEITVRASDGSLTSDYKYKIDILNSVESPGGLDVVMGGYGANSSIYISEGTGSFVKTQDIGVGYATEIEIGDVNGDGYNDFLIGYNQKPAKVYFNNKDGTFTDSGQTLNTETSDLIGSVFTAGIDLGDLDDDGDLDAIFAGANSHVYLNDGNGYFTEQTQNLFRNSFGVELGDLDKDGDLDALITGYGGTSVAINDGHANFSQLQFLGQVRYSDHAAVGVSLGDLDGDNDLDAAVIHDIEMSDSVFMNNGDGTFTRSNQDLGPDYIDPNLGSEYVHTNSYSSALGDIDSDGDIDLVIGRSSSTRLYLNDGSGNFTRTDLKLPSVGGYNAIDIIDTDGDGDQDIALAQGGYNGGAKGIQFYVNDGFGSFTLGPLLQGDMVGTVAVGHLDEPQIS